MDEAFFADAPTQVANKQELDAAEQWVLEQRRWLGRHHGGDNYRAALLLKIQEVEALINAFKVKNQPKPKVKG